MEQSNQNSHFALIHDIEAVEVAVDSLFAETSFKGLLRTFGNQLSKITHASIYSVLSFNENDVLNFINLKMTDLHAISTNTKTELENILINKLIDINDLKNGYLSVNIADIVYSLCALPNPHNESGIAFLIWNNRLLTSTQESLVNVLVKQVQRESSWYNKLNSTQSLLYKDELTGLFNYRYFEISIENELRRSGRFETPFSLLFIDLDDFKPINDTHGHPSGSGVLAQVADEIKEAIREIDIPIRYGGDEFVVLLLGANANKAKMVAERIRRRIESKNFKMEDGSFDKVTASIGIASFPEHGRTRASLLKIADKMMYECKKQGKNRVSVVKKSDLLTKPKSNDPKDRR